MKKRYICILIFISFIIIISSTKVEAQKANKVMITIESVVKDVNGNPIKGAIIYGNEGRVVAKTDASGSFSIKVPDQTELLIEADDFEPALFREGEYKKMQVLTLKSTPFLWGAKDEVNIAFGKKKTGGIANAVSVFNPEEMLQFDNTQDIKDAIEGQIPGLLGSSNVRGLGEPLYIVNGLPRDISSIKMSEVEQITVLKDMNAAILYGSAAVNGVVLITTKRGQAHKNQIAVTGYYGVQKPTELPKYLSSAEYMTLNNEARINDGLSPQYSQTDIDNYTSGNKYRYPSVDYYSSDYLKSVKPFWSATTELSGGNDNTVYYANLGWDQTGNLLNFGVADNSNNNRFNVRGNVDVNIASWVKSSIDVVGVYQNQQKPTGADYWSNAATLKPNLFSPLLPISMIDPENNLLMNHKNDVNGMYLVGGTSSNQTNPIASTYLGGDMATVNRTFSFTHRIDFDLNDVVQGLKFHTNMSFDLYSRYDLSNTNQYSVYEPVWSATSDTIISLTQYGLDTKSGSQNVSNGYYERKFGMYGMFDYDRTFANDHTLEGSLLLFGNKYNWQGNLQGFKNVNLGLRLNYSYKKKYLVDFSSNYVHSVKLPKATREALSPSLGLAWVISSEDFMSSVPAIDYLKLRASASLINSDHGIAGFYYWDPVIGVSGTYYWYDGGYYNYRVLSTHGGNPNLSWEKRKELNLGFEGIFFNHLLSVDGNIFMNQYYDQITMPTTIYPSYYTNFLPYKNFNNEAFRGAELGLSINRSFGDLSFVIGINGLYATSEVLKMDELYTNDYQYRKGKPVDALFGLVADGLFADNSEIASHALQAYGAVKPGDIKYIDQNNDNVIDENDQIQIGRTQSPYSYGLNLKIIYKNFTLFARGNGAFGADGIISNNYYWVDGNDKYSESVLNRWTEATKSTATFPLLHATANSNDFRTSTFWIYKKDYFRLNALQITYNIPAAISKMFYMKNLSFFANCSNLFMISKNKDIMNLSIGSEPYYRSFSIGIKTLF